MENQAIPTLHATFDLPLRGRDITRWRGAFAEWAGLEKDIFHNHKDGRKHHYHYRYPLFQYRSHKGYAAVFAVGGGVDALQQVFSEKDWSMKLRWENRPKSLKISGLELDSHPYALPDKPLHYHLRQWVPLNVRNHRKWDDCPNFVARAELLQRLLESHVMAAVWGLGWQPEHRVNITLLELRRSHTVTYHEAKVLAFDVSFSADISLPTGLGVGKGVSHGFGVLGGEEEDRR